MVPGILQEVVVFLYRSLTLGNVGLILAFVIGVGFVPFLTYFQLLGPLRGTVMRIMWTIASISLGGYGVALDQRRDGRYECNIVQKDADGFYIVRDGERHELEGSPSAWSRLGWRKFTVTYEKDDTVFEQVQAQHAPEAASADGGVVMTGVERGGYPEVVVPSDGDGWDISMSRVDTQLEGAGGAEPAFVAGEQALKNHGGDNAGMSNIALIISTLMALIFGSIMAYVVMAV